MHAEMASRELAIVEIRGQRKAGLPLFCSNDAGKAESTNLGAKMTITDDVPIPLIAQAMVGVDLPGYGYADVPEKIRKQWQGLLETYLARRQALAGLVVIMVTPL